ncbi:MAG: hypothetical protein QM698_04775 [Micropepsaceae bacterium]
MTKKLFAAAFVAGVALASPAYAASADLEGNWDAQNASAGGLAQLDITYDGRNFQVRASAVCSPRPCEFGNATGTPLLPPGRNNVGRDMSGITASFNGSDASRQITATVAGGNRLTVTTVQIYRDGRAATVTTETFRRASRQPEVLAECTTIQNNLRIRFAGGEWAVSQGNQDIARFDTPEEAGYARFLIAIQGLKQKCEIADAGFEYWTLSNGAFPQGSQAGEYCQTVGYRQITVSKSGRNWAVRNGNAVLYTVADRFVADTVAKTLIDNRVAAQCFVGEPGRGMTYFRR